MVSFKDKGRLLADGGGGESGLGRGPPRERLQARDYELVPW